MRWIALGVNVPVGVVLQQRVVIVFMLVLRSAVLGTMAGIGRRVGWGYNITRCGVAEGVIVIVARHEMRKGIRFVPVDQSRLTHFFVGGLT